MMAGLWWGLRPAGEPGNNPTAWQFSYHVGEATITGPAVLKVRRGDRVHIAFTSDIVDDLHLHGYEREVLLLPRFTAELEFRAELTGRFPLELHRDPRTIATLEVYP